MMVNYLASIHKVITHGLKSMIIKGWEEDPIPYKIHIERNAMKVVIKDTPLESI